ncbi:hypothetical protein Q4602_21970 [Paraglaciecola chathamensis]|uniref:hypothetical protein n=1 Tax=Paraglaciecola chathamensis TaxID=368405 RepID=UPI0027000E38|nr:hypothetical protein [Paraglaciecola chathamensis]MDO6842148.1 hypothetical protein [Paraglaciecola chathamensis]
MDWKTFIVQIINTLVWPVVLLVFLYIFKEQIQGLLKSLTKLTVGNASAIFSKEKLAEKFSNKSSGEKMNSEEPSAMSREDILNIPDEDYDFMQAIAANENFMPINKNDVFKYNSLVNHGYFEKEEDDVYKPTKKGTEIIAALKSIYYS